jgi:hypothetical protein
MNFTPLPESSKKQLLVEDYFSVKFIAVALDLGWPQKSGLESLEINQRLLGILKTVRKGFQSALLRAGIHLPDLDPDTPRAFLESLYRKTMPTDRRAHAWPDIQLDERTHKYHAWVRTEQDMPANHRIRTLSVNRPVFYGTCLSLPMPSGQWSQGDPSATQAIILDNMTEHQGVMVKGKAESPENLSFIPSCKTIESRDLYIAHEVLSIEEEGGHIRIADWWSGPVEPIDHPLKDNYHEASLGDALLIEMVHRSWRKNLDKGYWLSCTERLMLHGISEALFNAGICIQGFGSGRITIATPDTPEGEAEQDKLLSEFIRPLALQIPINHDWEWKDIEWRLPMLSFMQRYSLCGPDILINLDTAIDTNDQVLLDNTQEKAKNALKEMAAELQPG